MQWSQSLIRLQSLDLELEEHAQRLAEIATRLKEDAEVRQARRVADQRREAAAVARRHQGDLEFELGQVQIKRTRTEQNLYGGKIINSRELQDLQAELESLKRRVSVLEDQVLEAMLAREEADDAAKAAADRLAALEAALAQNQGALTAERDRRQAAVAALQGDRAGVVSGIPPRLLESYDYLRKRGGGIAVAHLRDDATCSVCGTELLRPTVQAVHRGQEAYCDTCRRILVVGS
jgi:hypothetical protein